jgi:serine/threonine-protein kinase
VRQVRREPEARPGAGHAAQPGRLLREERADGERSGGASLTVTVGELDAADEGGGTGPGPETTPSNGSTQRTIGLVVGGLGVIGIGIGTVFGLSAMSKENDATKNYCDSTDHCTGQGVQLGKDAQSAATASTIAFAVGGIALAGGVLLYFTAPKGSSAPTVGLRASTIPGGGTLGIQGAW